jgi:hypothetical protein
LKRKWPILRRSRIGLRRLKKTTNTCHNNQFRVNIIIRDLSSMKQEFQPLLRDVWYYYVEMKLYYRMNSSESIEIYASICEWITVLLEKLIVCQLAKKFPTFSGTQGSLPCSQAPATGPYTEAAESSPHPHTLFLQEQF